MTSIFKIVALFCVSILSAQNVSDYSYVSVPKKFADFKTNNQYNLNKILVSKLSDKNYKVIYESRENWAEEFQQNPCNILTAELLDDSNMLKNRVKLEFKDCYGKTILSIPATSSIKEYDRGFQEALLSAINKVPASQNTGNTMVIAETKSVTETVKATDKPETIQPANTQKEKQNVLKVQEKPFVTAANNKAEVYYNGSSSYNKVNLGAGHFIFTNSDSSVPFATFKEAGKNGVYHVLMSNGTHAIGYNEGNKMVIEIPVGDSTISRQEFSRK